MSGGTVGREYESIVRARIGGRVQRVGYRAWTEREARRRGLHGWVRNRSDGSVEAVFAGSADAVAAMTESLARGPFAARPAGVELLQATADDLAPTFGAEFVVLPTL